MPKRVSIKSANTDHPIHSLLSQRYSPYGFTGKAVAAADVRSIFEAARWSPSSYNEQPWSYIVALRKDPVEYERLLSCLVESNQRWAGRAAVLALGVVRTRFVRNDKPNPAAAHDLGLASAHLTFEASARGLAVHQMIGIVPARARELYSIPEHSEALTGLAIGYAAQPAAIEDERLRERDSAPRDRKPLADFVFRGAFGSAAGW